MELYKRVCFPYEITEELLLHKSVLKVSIIYLLYFEYFSKMQ